MDKVTRLNPRDIRAFIAVAELGSMTRTAEKLGLTQPAVTRRIQCFEDALGNPVLFDKVAKPATLTATGMQVVDHCRRILAELEGLSQVVFIKLRPSLPARPSSRGHLLTPEVIEKYLNRSRDQRARSLRFP